MSTPILEWVAGYRKEWLRFDVVAGLTAAAVVMPKAMAYATVAGLPLAVGPLHRALADGGLRAARHVEGVERQLDQHAGDPDRNAAGGPWCTMATPRAHPPATVIALLVGAMLFAALVLRLGFVANFVSAPVLTGFKAGIGLVIVLDQVPKLLGVHIHKAGFFQDLVALVADSSRDLGADRWRWALAHARWRWSSWNDFGRIQQRRSWWWRAESWPRGCSTSAQRAWRRSARSPAGSRPLTLPDLAWSRRCLPGALGIALMSFTETIAAGRAFAGRDDPRAEPESRAHRDRHRQPRRRAARGHARGWRHLANGREARARAGARSWLRSSPRLLALATCCFWRRRWACCRRRCWLPS